MDQNPEEVLSDVIERLIHTSMDLVHFGCFSWVRSRPAIKSSVVIGLKWTENTLV